MGKTVDYYFSPLSPWSYIGHQRFTDIAAKHGAVVNVKPIDFGRIFPVSGGLPLKQRAPQRQAYRLVELRRWREYLGVPLVIEPRFFPADAIPCTLAIIAADMAYGPDQAMALAGAFMRGCWVEERDLGDPETVRAIVKACGLDADRVLGAAVTEAARARFDAYNQQGIDAGVFGAPSYVVDGEIFWGQDRLEFVERALA